MAFRSHHAKALKNLMNSCTKMGCPCQLPPKKKKIGKAPVQRISGNIVFECSYWFFFHVQIASFFYVEASLWRRQQYGERRESWLNAMNSKFVSTLVIIWKKKRIESKESHFLRISIKLQEISRQTDRWELSMVYMQCWMVVVAMGRWRISVQLGHPHLGPLGAA